MENPLAKEIAELEKKNEELLFDEEENFEEAYKTVLIAIKDFCDECPFANQKCSTCWLGEHRERAQGVCTA